MNLKQQIPLGPIDVAPPSTVLEPARAQVAQAFQNGIREASVILVHGTCLNAVNRALETGVIPGGFLNTSRGESYLYLYNLPERFPFVATRCSLPKDNNAAFSGAASYAKMSSLYFDVCANLKLDPSKSEVYHAMEMIRSRSLPLDEHQESYRSAGLSRSDLRLADNFFKKNQTNNMVTLGFSKSLFTEFILEEAVKHDDGLRIATPLGIPIKFLHAIEPLTDHAYNYLDRLSSQVDTTPFSRESFSRE